MHALDIILNFFRDGGFFLYPIALIWVIGLVIALERFGFVLRVGAGTREDVVADSAAPRRRPVPRGLQAVSNSDTALANIMRYGITRIQTARRRDDTRTAMEESLVEVIPRLEKRTHYLSSLANIANAHGLFDRESPDQRIRGGRPGESRRESEPARRVDLGREEQPPRSAITAITLLLAHLYLETKTTEIVDSLEVASVKFLNALNEKKMDPESQQEAARGQARGMEAGVRGARA